MASMRVHELAKEFGMSSKELLDRLRGMKIPAKSHASVLADAYVEKIRKNLEPEIKQRAGQLKGEEAEKLDEERRHAAEKKAAEAAERRAAVEKERAMREAERAQRSGGRGAAARRDAHAPVQEQGKQAPKRLENSPFSALENQIKSEKERVAREAAEAKQRARAEALAREVAKKRAVEERLAAAHGGKKQAAKPADTAAPKKKAPGLTPLSRSSGFSSLLSQIESEQSRLASEQEARKAAAKNGPRKGKSAPQQGGGKRAQKAAAQGHSFEPDVPELTVQGAEAGEDRYAQMAVQAEKLQRDKVLAEARAAVEAASQESAGKGRRQKRKEKREKEKRERAAEAALEKGLDPTLVLDDSVIEIPQGLSACSRTTWSSACSCLARC